MNYLAVYHSHLCKSTESIKTVQRYIENVRKYHYLKRFAVKMGKNAKVF